VPKPMRAIAQKRRWRIDQIWTQIGQKENRSSLSIGEIAVFDTSKTEVLQRLFDGRK